MWNRRIRRSALVFAVLLALPAIAAAQALDAEYTAQIRRHTTEPFFLTPLVDHLPASSTVPTPLQHHGYIAGAPDVLTYPEDVARYMRAVADASPRVEVLSMGQSEEGREMILVIVSTSRPRRLATTRRAGAPGRPAPHDCRRRRQP
jgi:hypothetical protein